MNIYEAFQELDGIDGAAILTEPALGEILEAARNLAGAWDPVLDALASELAASSAEATLARLHDCLIRLDPHMPELSAQLWGQGAAWVANPEPCRARDAKVLFEIVKSQKPSLAMLRVKVNGDVLAPGGSIPIGATLAAEGRGFGYDPNLIFVRLRNRENHRDYWDFRVDGPSLDGRSLRLETPVPSLGIGTSIDILVGTGSLSRSSGVGDAEGLYAGKVTGSFGEYCEAGIYGTLVAGA
jgi:hypothetical protein